MARALIFGGTGFVGGWLARRLADRYEVAAAGRQVDVRDARAVGELTDRTRPDLAVNLAAVTTVREAMDDPRRTYDTAYLGLDNVLNGLQAAGFRGRFLQVSSSEVYGAPAPEALPLTEDAPLAPMNAYAVAKVMAEKLCLRRGAGAPFEVLIARPFTHVGPGQSSRFAVSNFARQLAEIRAKAQPPVLHAGDLTATRDLTDVRDVACAYDAILHHGRAGEAYNVCSGREIAMQAVLDQLVSLAGVDVRIVQDPARVRAAEKSRLLGSYAKLAADTGWRPEIPLAQTLADILEDSLARLGTAR